MVWPQGCHHHLEGLLTNCPELRGQGSGLGLEDARGHQVPREADAAGWGPTWRSGASQGSVVLLTQRCPQVLP